MTSDTLAQLLAGLTHVTWQSLVMIAIGCVLIGLAVVKEYEPLLLLRCMPTAYVLVVLYVPP